MMGQPQIRILRNPERERERERETRDYMDEHVVRIIPRPVALHSQP